MYTATSRTLRRDYNQQRLTLRGNTYHDVPFFMDSDNEENLRASQYILN